MQKCHCHKTFGEMIKDQGLTTRLSTKEIQMQYKYHLLRLGNLRQLSTHLSHVLRFDYHENIKY